MDLPKNLIDNCVFVPGFAFKKLHSSTSEPDKKRFFFVLNKTPNQDKVLVVSTTTTKIKKYKQKYPETIVEIDSKEYSPLTEKSIIVCEKARAELKSKVLGWIKDGNVENIEPLPESVMKRICTAVAKCKELPPEDKRKVLGEEEIDLRDLTKS